LARKVEQIKYEGGKEGTLETLGGVLLALGIVGLIAGVAIAVSRDDWAEGGSSWVWIIVGGASLIWGIVTFALLGAAAEAIRLLKKTVGMHYAGEISEGKPYKVLVCSACGKPPVKHEEHYAQEDFRKALTAAKKCENCGATFDDQ
jgi:hypothetical protein